jgi:hypothetical protein
MPSWRLCGGNGYTGRLIAASSAWLSGPPCWTGVDVKLGAAREQCLRAGGGSPKLSASRGGVQMQ